MKAGHADVVDLWEAVQQFAAQRSGKWLRLGRGGVTFDDLQQEAFIAMIQALEGWDPDAPVSENPDGETLVDFLPDTAPSVEELVEAADQRRRRHVALIRALNTLSERQRAAVVEYYIFRQKTKRTLRHLGLNRLREKHGETLKEFL